MLNSFTLRSFFKKDSQRTPKMIPHFGTVAVPLIGQCGPFTLLKGRCVPRSLATTFSRENKGGGRDSPKFEPEENRLFCQTFTHAHDDLIGRQNWLFAEYISVMETFKNIK